MVGSAYGAMVLLQGKQPLFADGTVETAIEEVIVTHSAKI